MTKSPGKSDVMGLVEYAKRRRLEMAREACRVCGLPDEVREQLRTASDRGIRRRDQLDWLRLHVGVDIADAELTTHRNGRHDEAA